MICRQFDIEKDYDDLHDWCRNWDIKPPEPDYLPAYGYIVQGLACGFIYFTDSQVSLIDILISNPNSDESERNIALDMVVSSLVDIAKKENAKIIIATTKLGAVRERALKHNFQEDGVYYSFSREI